MKQFTLVLILLYTSFLSRAQLTFSADTAYFNGFRKYDYENCHSLIRIKNTDAINSISCNWQKTNELFLNGWSGLFLTVNNIDFPYNSIPHTFTLAPGDSTSIIVYMKSQLNADDGCSDVELTLTSSGLPSSKNLLFRYCTFATSIDENSMQDQILISPNPIMKNIHIRSAKHNIDHINLSSITGMLIETFGNIPTSNEFDITPSNNIEPGFYVLTIFDTNNQAIGIHKLIKN